jgi:hypothetical protein
MRSEADSYRLIKASFHLTPNYLLFFLSVPTTPLLMERGECAARIQNDDYWSEVNKPDKEMTEK